MNSKTILYIIVVHQCCTLFLKEKFDSPSPWYETTKPLTIPTNIESVESM